jgi:hypothetical protein
MKLSIITTEIYTISIMELTRDQSPLLVRYMHPDTRKTVKGVHPDGPFGLGGLDTVLDPHSSEKSASVRCPPYLHDN